MFYDSEIKFKSFLSLTMSLIIVILKSQSPKDTCLKMHLVGAGLSIQNPGGKLAERYGYNMDVGVSYFFKTGKNLLFGIDPHYFYGNQVKEDVLAPLKTPEGTITNSDGNFGVIRINERGWNIHLCIGKIFPKIFGKKIGHNPNSGITTIFGAGYMLHYISFLNEERNIPQISGAYKKGYDRLTGGPCLKEFIGYSFLSNNRLLNFYGGFEFYQGFTKSLRSYDYDLMQRDQQNRIDLLFGFRIGWILPIYKRKESDNLFIY